MSPVDDHRDDPTMTLAFALDAIEAVEQPRAVFADARTWAEHVGIVSRIPRAGERFAREHGLGHDFFTGDRGMHESLAIVDRRFDTARYVLVGATEEDRRVADAAGWEYLTIDDAASKADWDLASPDGLVDRVARFLADRL